MTERIALPAAKEPLLRIVRRPQVSQRKAWQIRALALFAALLTTSLLILLLGHNPITVYADLLNGALGTRTSRIETIKITIPLLIAALSVAITFKMQFWNIGTEGQILAGGIAATYFALFWVDKLPRPALVLAAGQRKVKQETNSKMAGALAVLFTFIGAMYLISGITTLGSLLRG